jgi:hypothetical protein
MAALPPSPNSPDPGAQRRTRIEFFRSRHAPQEDVEKVLERGPNLSIIHRRTDHDPEESVAPRVLMF